MAGIEDEEEEEVEDALFFTDTQGLGSAGEVAVESTGCAEAEAGDDEVEAGDDEVDNLDELAKQISELEARIHHQESSIAENTSAAASEDTSIYVDDRSEEEVEPVVEPSEVEAPSSSNQESTEAVQTQELEEAQSDAVEPAPPTQMELEADPEIPAEQELPAESDAVVLVDDVDESEVSEVEYEAEECDETAGGSADAGEMVDSLGIDNLGESTCESSALEDQTDAVENGDVNDPSEADVESGRHAEHPSACKNGYVFVCSKATQQECQKLMVLGSPQRELAQMKRCISQDTWLFLLNLETWKLIGPFGAVSTPELDIVPNAFQKRFRAQVRITPLHPLGEVQMAHRIPAGPKNGVQVGFFRDLMAGSHDKTVRGWGDSFAVERKPRTIAPKSRASPPPSPAPSSPPCLPGDDVEGSAVVEADQLESFAEDTSDHATGIAEESMEVDNDAVELIDSGDEILPSPIDEVEDGELENVDVNRTGYVFVCSKTTQQECKELLVFGSPERELPQMKERITQDTWIFLLNIDVLKLIGPFSPSIEPALDIVPSAFKKRFRAQVRVMPMQPLMEVQLGQRIPAGPKTAEEVTFFSELMMSDEAEEMASWNASAASSSNAPEGSPSVQTPRTVAPKANAKVAAKAKSANRPAPKAKGATVPYYPNPRATILPKSRGSPPASPLGTQPPAKKRKLSNALVDEEGRKYQFQSVVVNFANVGATYASRVLGKNKERCERMFDWEGVRRCVRCLRDEQGLQVVGVLFENLWGPDKGNNNVSTGVPEDIRGMCHSIQETPKLDGRNHKSADDEVTIKCAYRRNCRFLDNDNYRDWRCGMRDAKCRRWLEACQEFMQMRYFFDSELGSFDVLDGNMPAGYLANGAGQV